jgi:two-component system, chemotaxis family, sensor kinase CheA
MTDELLDQFLIEGRELVQQASEDLLALERDPGDAARIDSVFRAIHTLKGSVALFDFAPMGSMLHAAEDLLGAVRAQHLAAGRAVIDALLACVGTSEAWIGAIACSGALPADAGAEAERLRVALSAPLGGAAAGLGQAVDPAWVAGLLARVEASVAARAVTALRYVPAADCFYLGDDPMQLARAIPDLLFLHIGGNAPWQLENFDPFACNLCFEALSAAPAERVRAPFRFVPDQVAIVELAGGPVAERPGAPKPGGDAAARTLRVDAARIDALVDLVGELMVAKNGLAHLAAQAADPTLARALHASHADIERLAASMHRAVMGVRMLPLARTFRRLPRLVRDIAAQLGKEVAFDIGGEDVQADKTIVDALFEPLLHVLRNAVDHGIEDAALRRAAGKPPAGRVTLRASRAGDQIVIAVADDGAGVDPARVREAAVARGLVDASAIDTLDDRQAAALIFTPGFSIATAVTAVSGRGVGMDAVRAGVEALGGRVALESTQGAGTIVTLTLPQALMVTTVMSVLVGGERFGIPMDVVAETARIPVSRIVPIRAGEAFVLRDRTIPLLRLASLLRLGPGPRAAAHARVLICAFGAERVGVEVDGFGDRMDVLVRPLTGLLAGMQAVLGTALLGDGRVLLVLDVAALVG